MTGVWFALRWYFFLPAVLLIGLLFFVEPANAQGLVQCGLGAGAPDCQFCHLIALINNIIKFFVSIAAAIAAILFCYAGFLFFTSGGSEERISKAKSIFGDVVIGFIITLVAYVAVSTLLNTLAQGALAGPSWSSVSCVSGRLLGGTFGGAGATTGGGGLGGGGGGGSTVVRTGDCATGNIPQPTGSTWTPQQTQIMSCIAQLESTCNASAQYNGPANSNATGLYQVIIGGFSDPGHSLNFPSCSAAAGVTGNLNCYDRWIAGGRQLRSPQLDVCFAAARNPQCNTDAANYLLQDACSRGNCYSPWAQTSSRCI